LRCGRALKTKRAPTAWACLGIAPRGIRRVRAGLTSRGLLGGGSRKAKVQATEERAFYPCAALSLPSRWRRTPTLHTPELKDAAQLPLWRERKKEENIRAGEGRCWRAHSPHTLLPQTAAKLRAARLPASGALSR